MQHRPRGLAARRVIAPVSQRCLTFGRMFFHGLGKRHALLPVASAAFANTVSRLRSGFF